MSPSPHVVHGLFLNDGLAWLTGSPGGAALCLRRKAEESPQQIDLSRRCAAVHRFLELQHGTVENFIDQAAPEEDKFPAVLARGGDVSNGAAGVSALVALDGPSTSAFTIGVRCGRPEYALLYNAMWPVLIEKKVRR